MGQKFFISFNSADQIKAHWIAWTLKESGHEVAVHDWEIPAGGNAPLWMNKKLAWADRLIAVISPDYLPTRYSPMEWASQIWNETPTHPKAIKISAARIGGNALRMPVNWELLALPVDIGVTT
jgi:TIR domain